MYCLELVYGKNYFKLSKIFILRLFKTGTNQRVIQSGIKVCHQNIGSWEVQTIWNLQKIVWCVWRTVLIKNVYRWAKHRFSLTKQCWKTVHWVFNKGKVPGSMVCKESHAVLQDIKGLITLKNVQVSTLFPIANPSGKLHLIELALYLINK